MAIDKSNFFINCGGYVNPTRNRSSIIYLLLFVAIIILVVYQFQQSAATQEALPINKIASDIQSGLIARIEENEDRLVVIYADGSERISHKEPSATLVEQLQALV
jgi:cell division protease FtsH